MAIRKFYFMAATVALLSTILPGAPLSLSSAPVLQAQAPSTCDELYQEDLVGYWTFDESRDPMVPFVGTLRGTEVGSISSAYGIVGRALEFNGGAYVNYGTSLDIPAWDSYTVAIWFLNDGRLSPVKGYGQKIIDKTTWFSDFFIGLPNNPDQVAPRGVVFMYDRDFKNIQTTGDDYIDSQWHHAVITKNGTHGELWVDGVLIGAKDDVNPTINSQPLLLGYSLSGDGYQRLYWGGYLDEFAVFNRALSASEIGDLYQRSQSGQPYCTKDHFVVNSTATYTDGICDPLSCTLFEAITAANAHPGHDTIAFNIPGPGPYTINHTSLTDIRGPITIDGYTQPGSHPSTTTDPAEMDAKPLIALDGANVSWEGSMIEPPHSFTVCLDGTDCVIQGLVFQNYRIPALQMGPNVLLTGNFIGTDVTGTISRPNATYSPGSGTIDRSSGHVVGNLFSGPGIMMWGGNIEVRNNRFGVGMDGAPLPVLYALRYIPSEGYATIVGNYFAYPTTGTFSVAGGYIANNRFLNAGGGIGCGTTFRSLCIIEDNILTDSGGISVFLSNGSTVRRNLITGSSGVGISVNGRDTLSPKLNPTMIIEENLIAHNNGTGILAFGSYWIPADGFDNVFMTVRKNRIFDNGGLGIDLSARDFQPDGVTPNDLGDLDTSGNSLQNFPELAYAGGNTSNTVIQGMLSTSASDTFILDFYANSACDPSGYGEGERYLGQTTVTTDENGNASFTVNLPTRSAQLESLTATATNSDGATSEFSQCIVNAGIVNDYLAQESVSVDYARLGEGLFAIHATFRNASAVTLNNGFFKVAKLAYPSGDLEPAELVVRNAIGAPQGAGALVAMPAAIGPGTTFMMIFEIHLPRLAPFDFYVDAFGLSTDGVNGATVATVAPATGFAYNITDLDQPSAVELTNPIFLPMVVR